MGVLLIEDDARTAHAVMTLFSGEKITAEHVANGTAGLRRAGDPAIQVIVLDRMLPDFTGIEVLDRIRAAGIAKPVLILSALGRCAERVEGLDLGADDYLAKPFEPEELVARVRALLRRADAAARQPIYFHGDLELNVGARTAHRCGRHLALSPKEFEVLKLLMESEGALVTRSMLLRQIWKLNFDPQTNVVDVNLARLRRKLEDGFPTPCLKTVRGSGYRLI